MSFTLASTISDRPRLLRWLLLAIAASLIAIHLTLLWRMNNASFWGVSVIFWGVVGSRLWEQRQALPLKSDPGSTVIGLLILMVTLLKTTALPTSNFLAVYPFLVGVALLGLAAGFGAWRYYRRDVLLLFVLGVPQVVLSPMIDFSPVTARFSTFLLWYGGVDVQRWGTLIQSPAGIVDVNMGCSGLETMFYLLGLSILALVMYPLRSPLLRIITPAIAILVAFGVNSIRVAVLALLAGPAQAVPFKYWHEGNGSLLFALTAVCLFGGCYWAMMEWDLRPAAAPLVTDDRETLE